VIKLDEKGNSVQIRCNACGTTNRVPLRRLHERPVCGRCKGALAVNAPVEVTDDSFETVIAQAALPVLVDFWAPWCGPCRAVAPIIEELAKEYAGKVEFAKINVDESPLLASKYNVMSIPTIIIFKGGKPIQQAIGLKPKNEFKKMLDF